MSGSMGNAVLMSIRAHLFNKAPAKKQLYDVFWVLHKWIKFDTPDFEVHGKCCLPLLPAKLFEEGPHTSRSSMGGFQRSDYPHSGY